MAKELNAGDKHILRLTKKEAGPDGWSKVSKQVWPLVQSLPSELVELQPHPDGGGIMRLTDAGNNVVDWLL